MVDFLLILIFLTIFLIIKNLFKSSYFKGKIGEIVVDTTNNIRLDNSIYTTLSNLTIKLKDGSTTQIDHIIISKFGIFIIETKNMKGHIFASREEKIWTQVIYGKKYTFQNPLHQNYRHIKAIEELLNIKNNIYSIVVFVGNCKFKTDIPRNVFIGGKYIKYIKSFHISIFTNHKVKGIINLLKNRSLKKGKKTDKEHVLSLKKRHKSLSPPYADDLKIICKRCSSLMVKRINKKTGEEFFGCSNYPKCKN